MSPLTEFIRGLNALMRQQIDEGLPLDGAKNYCHSMIDEHVGRIASGRQVIEPGPGCLAWLAWKIAPLLALYGIYCLWRDLLSP